MPATSGALVVRRKKRDVLVFRNGRRVSRIRATVGAPSTPTPQGVFTITRRYRFKPSDREFRTYGCCVLALDITVFAPFGGKVALSFPRSTNAQRVRGYSVGTAGWRPE